MIDFSEAVRIAHETGDTSALKAIGKEADKRAAALRVLKARQKLDRLQKQAETLADKAEKAGINGGTVERFRADMSVTKPIEIEPEFSRIEETETERPPQRLYIEAPPKRSYGEGRVYRQKRKLADGTMVETGPYWIQYCRRGKPFRESAKTMIEKEARKLLKRRLEEMKKPAFVGPSENKLGIEDLQQKVLADYEKHNRRSKKTVEFCFKPLKAFFTFDRLIDVTPSRVEQYQNARLKQKAARATVNRECAYLRRGFKLLAESGEISATPAIRLLEGENIRQGFINAGDLDKLLKHLPSDDARDIAEFLFNSAWRSGEAKSLEWRDVDRDGGMIRLRAENSKNGKPRLLPLIGALSEIIERRWNKRRLDCPFVFHRNGKQIRSFSRGWKTACKEIGQPNLVPHDMRRSGVRNFRKAGLSESEGMMLSGHKTNAVYRRYDIIDEQDLRESMAKVQDHLARQQEAAKVAKMKAAK